MSRIASGLLFAALATGLSACGGGGGGGSTPPGPTPAPGCQQAAAVLPPAGATGSFQLASVPAALAVTVANPPAATTHVVTPASVTPGLSNQATTFSFQPTSGAAPFTFTTDQRNVAAQTVFYNQCADTSGTLASVSPSSTARHMSAAQPLAALRLPRFPARGSAARPRVSATSLIVRYRAAALGSSAVHASDIERATGVVHGANLGTPRGGFITRVVALAPGDDIAALTARLRARPEVASVSPDRLFYKQSAPAVSVNDTYFNTNVQWNLTKIGTPNAWGYFTAPALPGTGVTIATIDTGVDASAVDLAGKVTYAEKVVNGTTTVGNAAAQDTDGHGTNVASIAAADTNNATGFAGVGYNVKLQVYRVFRDGTASDMPAYSAPAQESDVLQALYDAVTHGANVINLSLGSCQSGGPDPNEAAAVQNALASNVVVVAAAGNERGGNGQNDCAGTSSTIDYPAADDGVIAVGASKLVDNDSGVYSTATEAVASYSNSGPGLALVAPGGDPTAADQSSSGATNFLHWITGLFTTTSVDPSAHPCTLVQGNCIALYAGTSQATPHVAAVAALMLSAQPGLTPAQIKQALISTADDINDPNQGGGRLNAYRALAAVAGDPAPPSLPANLNFVAFAYVANGTNVPHILDVTYTKGVPVARSGAFRIADLLPSGTGYKIGVWADVNGDGVIDTGDYFGTSSLCSSVTPCTTATGITAHPVASGFILQ